MRKCKLGDLFEIKQGYAFKSEKYQSTGKYVLCTLGNISADNNFKYDLSKANYYPDDFSHTFILEEGDLIIPLTEQAVGLFGNTAFVPPTKGFQFVLNQRVGKVIPQKDAADKYYLHYLLSTELVRNQIEATATGTSQRNTSPEKIYDVTVWVPDIEQQRKIGKTLFDLERKVNTNKLINDNLEQQAKLLYDYWFTQFDFPDENGNPYRASGGQMEWNATLKRNIPIGWRVIPFLEVASWESNSQPPKSEFIYEPKDGYIRFIQNRDYDSSAHKTYIPLTKSLSIVDRYDILMDKYGDAGAVRYGIEGAFNVALGKINVHDKNHREYVRSFLASDGIYDYLHNSCMASTRASLNESNLAMLNIVIPDEPIVAKYEELLRKMRDSILTNNDETEKLIELRDWLLPMLMNGQAFVED